MKTWYKDLCYDLRRVRGKIGYQYHFLKRWFSYYKVLKNAHDFDWESILIVEKHQITRVKDTITKCHDHVNWKNDVWWMDIALKLLDIVREDGCAELVKDDLKRVLHNDGFYHLVGSMKWSIPVYVNISNYKRFYPVKRDELENANTGPLMKDRLRVEKAWYLYNKIKLYKMRSWWD